MPRDDIFGYEYFPTKTAFCDVCGKQKAKGMFSHRDDRGVVCGDCAAREAEERLPDMLVEVRAEWQERLPREAGFAVGDRIEVEGHDLAVMRVDELAPSMTSKLALRVWLRHWPDDQPVPVRDPETLERIRQARDRKRKGRSGERDEPAVEK